MTENNSILLHGVDWYRANIDKMPVDVLREHHRNIQEKIAAYERGSIFLDESMRLEITEILGIMANRLDDIIPKLPFDVSDHDKLCGQRSATNWPDYLPRHTLLVHSHWCELLHSWNLNPFRTEDREACVDIGAETTGMTCFIFPTKADANDFLDYNSIDDFVEDLFESTGTFCLILKNKFDEEKAKTFFSTYSSAMNALAIVEEERRRAIRNDGGKVTYVSVQHFSDREIFHLLRIKQARLILGGESFGKG